MTYANDEQIKKALVTLAIEKTLLAFGKPTLDKVSDRLFEEYHCYIPDCYRKPEYLSKVLKDVFGNSHTVIVESIGKHLAEFASQEPIKNFLSKLNE